MNRFLPVAVISIFTTVTCFALQQTALSQNDSTVMLNENITITAQRMNVDENAVADAVVLLDRDQIIQLSPMSTPDAMSTMAGVWMQKTNHGGGSPFIRGLTGYQTLLLIDGIRFNNSTFRSGPNQYVNTIDPLTLQRIEVLRGQGSVQYGSDAIGGVGHFIMREPEFANRDRLAATGRIYGQYVNHDMEYAGRAEMELGTKKFALLGGIGAKELGDIRGGGELGTLHPTGYGERSWDVKGKAKIGDMQLIGSWQHLIQKDVPLYHQLVTGSYSRYHFTTQQRDMGYIRLESTHASKFVSRLKYTLAYLNSLEEREKQRPNNPVMRYERDEVDTYHAAIETISVFSSNWKASSGMEFYHDYIQSSANDVNQTTAEVKSARGLYPNGTQYSNLAAFSLHSIDKNRFNLSFGGRYNFVQLRLKDPQFGTTIIQPDALVGNAGLVFHASNYFALLASANTGFRAPNVNDVASFGVADYRYEVPNYDLNPEKSFQYQTGFRVQSSKFAVEIIAYQNHLRDLISNVPSTYNGLDSLDGAKVYKKENVNKALVKGIESEINYKPTTWINAFGNLTYTLGENVTRDEPLSRIPPVFGRIGTDLKFRDFLIWRLELVGAGKQDRLSSGDKQDIRIQAGGTPAWSVVNTRLQFVYKNFQLNTGVQNIFDKAYRVHGSGVDGMGRSFLASLIIQVSK